MPSEPLMTVADNATRDFTHKLKTETAEKHQQLEQSQLSVRLMRPAVQKKDYALYLSALLSVQQFTEQTIFPIAGSVIKDLSLRYKHHLLLNDITSLEMDDSINLGHVYQPAEEAFSMEYALAHVYVMEGSTLGGKIIGRHVFNCLGINATSGASYFDCYGDFTGKMWKSFLEPFAQYAINNRVEEGIIEAANKIFSSLLDHFEKSLDR